jgi:hypothetical protein
MNEGLILIGGVQDDLKANNIQMIFYRTEILRTSGSLKTNYDIQVDLQPDSGSA